MVISTVNMGTADYSIQLVQPDVPLQKGGTYKVTFDAYADEARTMIADISGPDHNYTRYWKDTKVELGTQKTTYTYAFQMTGSDDANGRLEFNLGNAASTAAVHLSNVRIERPDMKKSKKTPQRKCLQTEIMSTTVPSRKGRTVWVTGTSRNRKMQPQR